MYRHKVLTKSFLAVFVLAIFCLPLLVVEGQVPQPVDRFALLEFANKTIGPQYSEVIRQFFGGVDPVAPPVAGSGVMGKIDTGLLRPLQAVAEYTLQITNDVSLDCETTLTTLDINEGGVNKDFTIVGYMKFVAAPADYRT